MDHKLEMGMVTITMEAWEQYRKLWMLCQAHLDNPYAEPEDLPYEIQKIIEGEDNG